MLAITEEVISKTDVLIIILGVHVPGKYLTALPGTLQEVVPLLKDIKCKKILTGPAVFGAISPIIAGLMRDNFGMQAVFLYASVIVGLVAVASLFVPMVRVSNYDGS